MARSGDDNGDNDNHSVAAASLVEYPDLWRTNPYGSGGGWISAIVGIESRTVCLPVWQSSGGGRRAVPRQRGQHHVAKIVMLCNN